MAEQVTQVLGIVGISNKGDYNSQTSYEKLNVVTYQGSSYCAKQNCKGVLPTNPDYWQLYAEKGEKGDIGPQGPIPVKGIDYYTTEDREAFSRDISSDVHSEVVNQIGELTSATPLAASSVSEMTDTSRIYVNTSDGYWYYYNGNSWVAGAVYQATTTDDYTSGAIKLAYNIPSYDNSDWVVNTMSLVRASIAGTTGALVGDQGGKRLRTGRMASFGENARALVVKVINDDYVIAPRWYSNNTSSAWEAAFIESEGFGKGFYMGKNPYCAFVIKRLDEDVITDEEIETIRQSIKFYLLTDKTLSQENVPADAKKVGEILSNLVPPFNASMSMYSKFGVCGASWDSGYFYPNPNASAVEREDLSWGANIARRNGNKHYNFSRHSMNTRTYLTNQYCLPKLLNSDVCDLYLLCLGGNDSNYLGIDYLGTINDITNDYTQNPDTFYGNYARIIEQIQNHAPNAKIIMCMSYDEQTQSETRGLFSEAVSNIAAHYGIPRINWANDKWYTSDFMKNNYTNNHPTAIQLSGVAYAFERLYSKCVETNYNYFKDYNGGSFN